MADDTPSPPPPPPSDPKSKPTSSTSTTKSTSRTTYISGGRMLESPPLTTRFTRFIDDTYNFLGLYFVSLFSLDPYTSAQNSQFNTRANGGRRVVAAASSTTATPGAGGAGLGAMFGFGGGGGGGGGAAGVRGGNTGSRGGSGGGGGGPGGRRLGTVDDVRSPECGSCG